jgi:hypothetical protein
MSETLRRVQGLVLAGEFRVSDHGFDELEDDAIPLARQLSELLLPLRWKNIRTECAARSVLALQRDADGRAIHVIWAIPAGQRRPAVRVTAYRPDPNLWSSDFKQRNRP